MQLLRDNLTLWTSDTQGDGDEPQEGGDNWKTSPSPTRILLYTITPIVKILYSLHLTERVKRRIQTYAGTLFRFCK